MNHTRTAESGKEQFSLGNLIDALEKIEDKSKNVYIDFEQAIPYGLGSYRGSYDELCMQFAFNKAGPTVKDLLKELHSTVGAIFEGWKGGEFLMTKDTPIWIAETGNVSRTVIVAVADNDYDVLLKIDHCEF